MLISFDLSISHLIRNCIFQPIHCEINSTTSHKNILRKGGNTGMGLYIVKSTIEDYAGGVCVKDNKHKGAEFVVRLRKGIDR